MSSKDLVEGVDYILDEEGHKINPKTGNLLKGFALNPEGINKGGRPLGSRNKSSIIKAQRSLDDAATIAVDVLIALATNDKEYLNDKKDVPATVRAQAAKEILNRVVAPEKEKPVEKVDEEDSDEDDEPIVSTQPINTQKTA